MINKPKTLMAPIINIAPSFLLTILILIPFVQSASTALSGDYNKQKELSPKALLNYRIDEKSEIAHLALTVTDPTTITSDGPSYVGLGIGEPLSGSMLGSDIVTAEFKSGRNNDDKCTIKDRHTPFAPYPLEPGPNGVFPVEDSCEESDWKLVNCARDVDKGILVLEVSRALKKGSDTQDRDIGPGEQQIMYAYGGAFAYHGQNRQSVAVTLYGKAEGLREAPDDLSGNQLFLSSKYKVPTVPTTYSCTGTIAKVPSGGKITVVGAEPVIEEKNVDYVHHFLLYVCSNNNYFKRFQGKTTECQTDGPLGNPESGCTGIIYGWAKGGTTFYFPKITGFELDDSNKYLVLETHFDNPSGKADIVDSSGVRLFYSNKNREQPGAMMVIGDGIVTFNGEVVRHQQKYQSTCPSECTSKLEKPVTVFGSGLHMHTTGQRIYTNHYDKNGKFIATREAINFWSDSWQKFGPTKPWKISPGDQLSTTCVFDTSKRPNTTWGLETKNEMCMHFLFVYPAPKLKPKGGPLYFCGIVAGDKLNATLCSAANEFRTGVLPVKNPSFEDRAGFDDTFGDKPTVCRSGSSNSGEGSSTQGSASPDGDGDDPECFPSSARIQLASGRTVTMDQLSVGDRVKVASGKYSTVYFFSHHDPTASSKFVEISASSQTGKVYTLTASRGHFIVTGKGLVEAVKIQVGDTLYDESGATLSVTRTRLVSSVGLYSPHTMDGNILVDGVRTSTYSSFLPPKFAHTLLLPERISYHLGFSVYGGQGYVSGKSRNSGRPFVVESAYQLLRSCKLPISH